LAPRRRPKNALHYNAAPDKIATKVLSEPTYQEDGGRVRFRPSPPGTVRDLHFKTIGPFGLIGTLEFTLKNWSQRTITIRNIGITMFTAERSFQLRTLPEWLLPLARWTCHSESSPTVPSFVEGQQLYPREERTWAVAFRASQREVLTHSQRRVTITLTVEPTATLILDGEG
jgi:hypothetical protein